jgi:hypothetical protein
MDAVIGMMQVSPADVGEDGEYVVEFPAGTRALCVGWVNDHMVMWVAVPTYLRGEAPDTVKQRFLILPGSRKVVLPSWAQYLGTVISRDESGEADHDWHFFTDISGIQIYRPAQSTYSLH